MKWRWAPLRGRARAFAAGAALVAGVLAAIATSGYQTARIDGPTAVLPLADLYAPAHRQYRVCADGGFGDQPELRIMAEARLTSSRAFELPITLRDAAAQESVSVLLSPDQRTAQLEQPSVRIYVLGDFLECTGWFEVEIGPLAGAADGTMTLIVDAKVSISDAGGAPAPDDAWIEVSP